MTLCAAADRAPLAQKRSLLEHGLADAERAANADVAAEARRLLTRLGG